MKLLMKRILAILLFVSIALLLFGCGMVDKAGDKIEEIINPEE